VKLWSVISQTAKKPTHKVIRALHDEPRS